MKKQEKRVGIMGGTFDPIHIGHLILGENAYEQFDLERVLFMPSGNPPHKAERSGGASNDQRVQMVQRAIENNPHFELSLAEMHDQGYNYTSVTLEKLCTQNPDIHYYFIMGADSLFSFDTWHCPQEICRYCTLVVAVRDHLPSDRLKAEIERVRAVYGADIELLCSENIDISSSQIREWISSGKSCRYYLPESVREYICDQGIYA